MQHGSPADVPRRFRTGRPCLDLVHTGREGALARWEIVNDPDNLGRLLGVILRLPALPENEADLAVMRPLPAALTRIAYDLAEGSRPPIPIDPPRPDDICHRERGRCRPVARARAAPGRRHHVVADRGGRALHPCPRPMALALTVGCLTSDRSQVRHLPPPQTAADLRFR
jgi:hypothetical protein